MFISARNQLMRKLSPAICLLCLFCLSLPAQAGVRTQTIYNYFPVKGKTARQIYLNIKSHGREQGDPDALASTDVGFSQHPTFVSHPTCHVQSLTANLVFRINLPRLGNLNALSPDTPHSWTAFTATLKAHEEHHRMIWTSCAERLTRHALQIRTGNCADFKAAYLKMSKNFLPGCKAENDAFDATEGTRFLTLPFIRQAAGGP
jgi:predicted secreted Zn-dependent protease